MELKKIALELLDKYRDAKIEKELQELSDECYAYLKAIEVNSDAED